MFLAYVTKEAIRCRGSSESIENVWHIQGLIVSQRLGNTLKPDLPSHLPTAHHQWAMQHTPGSRLGSSRMPDPPLTDFVFPFTSPSSFLHQNREFWTLTLWLCLPSHGFAVCFSYHCGVPHQVRWHPVQQVLDVQSSTSEQWALSCCKVGSLQITD